MDRSMQALPGKVGALGVHAAHRIAVGVGISEILLFMATTPKSKQYTCLFPGYCYFHCGYGASCSSTLWTDNLPSDFQAFIGQNRQAC